MGCISAKDNSMTSKVSFKYSKRQQVLAQLSDAEKEFIKRGWQSLSGDIGGIGVLTFVRYVVDHNYYVMRRRKRRVPHL